MKQPQQINNLQNYYDVSYMLNDNITLIAILIHTQGVSTIKKIETDLISLRVDKYALELDCILDMRVTMQKTEQIGHLCRFSSDTCAVSNRTVMPEMIRTR